MYPLLAINVDFAGGSVVLVGTDGDEGLDRVVCDGGDG